MKKIICSIIVVIVITTLAGCSKTNSQLNGDWEIVSDEDARFGRYLRFEKNGAMYCTPGISKDDKFVNIEDEFCRTAEFYDISYRVLKNETVELTIKVFGEKLVIEIVYTVDKDILIFDGKTYKKIS